MVYRFGDCTLDIQRHRLQRGSQLVRLRPKALEVLRYLLEQRDRTVLKSELRAQAWPQQFISDATLDSTVRTVRQAIGDSGCDRRPIQTVYGYGYRFVAAVEEIADLPDKIEDKTLAMPSDTVVAHLQDAPAVVLLPPAQESVVEPDGREGGSGTAQDGAPLPGDLLQSGEWKLVTVLCAAPVIRSAGGAHSDADIRYRQLSRLYILTQPVVQRYEGTLHSVLGDHVLAVFGAPVAQEDHAQRAVLAALELQRRVRQAGIDDGAQQGDALGLRVGLYTGQVAVGGIGDATAGLAVVGETVMRALALQAQAAPGTLLCGAATAHLVQKVVRTEAVAPVLIAGEPTPIAAYTVLGPYRRRPFLALARQVWTPFVGRHRELATLRALLTQVEEGQGQVVGMIGEPGVGKSRLCYEFVRGSLVHPWLILGTQGTAYGQAIPYLPVIDLLKSYFHIDDRDDLPTIRDKVSAKLRRLDDALTPTAPALLTLLDVPVEDPPWQAIEAHQRRQRILDAVKRLLLWESQRQPLLLVVENLHWIDAETQAVLDTLVESLPAARIFLLTTYRPEYRHAWGNKTYYMQLRLDPLPRERARELVDALLGDAAALEPLKQRLVERTQGNPFFLEESIRSLAETQVLVGEPGAYRPANTLPNIQVPPTVQAVLAARIDHLPNQEKRLLQTAAVIGIEVSFPLLQAIAELPEEGLRTGLAHLQSAEFLYETSLFPELAYTFKHALTQEVAYGSLLREHRRILHAGIVSAIQALYAERQAEQVERLAYHAFRGEVWEKAVAYCRQAGEKALAQSAYREATGVFEQALRALQHLPETHATHEQAIDLCLALRSALRPLGEPGRTLTYLREAESLAVALDDPRRLAQVSRFLSLHFSQTGAYDQAIAYAQRTLALAVAGGEAVLQALANYYLGLAYKVQGEYRRAVDCLGQAVAFFEGARCNERFGQAFLPAVLSRAQLAACHAELGTFVEGRTIGEEGLRIAEAVDHPGSLMLASWGIGLLSLRQGDLHRTLPILERAVRLCHEADFPAYFPMMAAALGAAYTLVGRVADAMPLLTQALEQSTATEMIYFEAFCTLSLGQAHLLAGRLEKAQALAKRALAVSRGFHERGHQAYALSLRGEIAARREPPESESAEPYYRQALTLADELGMRPLQAHCRLGLGKLYLKLGWLDHACAELTSVIELYRAMDMTFWLPQAQAALTQIGA